MSRNDNILKTIDWLTIAMFVAIMLFGWMNIYGASYNFEQTSIFDFGNRAGKQFVWILTALLMGGIILLIDSKVYNILAYIIYGIWIVVLIVTPILASDIKGSLSWIKLGPVSLQPAEFAKCFTALALAKYMGQYEYRIRDYKDLVVPGLLIMIPMFIIMVLQKETGSALVFLSFLLMFYREGMTGYVLLLGAAAICFFVLAIKLNVTTLPIGVGSASITVCMLAILLIDVYFLATKTKKPVTTWMFIAMNTISFGVALLINQWTPVDLGLVATITTGISSLYLLIIGIKQKLRSIAFLMVFNILTGAYCYSCNFMFNNILQPHQRTRIEVLLGLKDDLSGAGYNVNQSKIAIGSGGVTGKGFLQGTQTKLKFVPEQDTDFIFCTVGEEWGFIGSAGLLILYLSLIMRLIHLAEKQKRQFNRIYGYCVAGILIFHLVINIGMVLGLLPVIGIPLPLFSYGGSSLWGFSILLFIFLKLDADGKVS